MPGWGTLAGLSAAFLVLAASVVACTPASGGASGTGGHASSGGNSGTGGSGAAGTGGGPPGTGGAATGGGGSGGAASGGSGPLGSGGTASGGSSSGGSGTGGASTTADASADMPTDQGSTGGSSTGTGGGSSPDGGQPAGCAGLFCEDFESGAIDPNVWSVNNSFNQTVTVQKATVSHGKYAVQFHAAPNVLSYDLLITKSLPAALKGHHFGRAYVNATPMPPDQHMTVLFAGTTGFPKMKYLEVGSIHNQWQLSSQNLVGINSSGTAVSGSSEKYSAPGGAIPLGKWFCLEWEFNDAPDQIRVFVNGKEDYSYTDISFGGTTTGQVGGFTQFGLGYAIWHPATYVFDMYYDDIVLDTKQVGCLP